MKRNPMECMMPLDAKEAQTLKLLSQTMRGITHNPWKREMLMAMAAGASKGAYASHTAAVRRKL
jgi:hypothetical protein